MTTALGSVLVIALIAAWTLRHPEVYTSQLTPAEIQAYVGTDFEHYYSEFPHHEFATLVWVNNAWVAAQCIAFGVLGLPVLYVLFQNVQGVGIVAALMMANDRTSLFFGLILPHGLLELTAVFVAAAVGLRLFWSWVEPGPRTRLQAFAAEGRTAIAIAIGLVFVLLVSGAIEGFVTPVRAAHLGADRDRGRRRVGLPGLRLRGRAPGPPAPASRATSSPRRRRPARSSPPVTHRPADRTVRAVPAA